MYFIDGRVDMDYQIYIKAEGGYIISLKIDGKEWHFSPLAAVGIAKAFRNISEELVYLTELEKAPTQ